MPHAHSNPRILGKKVTIFNEHDSEFRGYTIKSYVGVLHARIARVTLARRIKPAPTGASPSSSAN